jgi:hypothetical protein
MPADTAHRNESPSVEQTRVYLDELTKLPREIHRDLHRVIDKLKPHMSAKWADEVVEALDMLLDTGDGFCALRLADEYDDDAHDKALGLLVEQAR